MSRPLGGRRPPQLADVSLQQPRPTAIPRPAVQQAQQVPAQMAMPQPAVQQAQQAPATAFKPRQFRRPQVMPTMGIDPRRNIGSPRQLPQFARDANQQAQRAMARKQFMASLRNQRDLFNKYAKARQQAGSSDNRQRAAFLADQKQKIRMFNMQQRGADPRQMFRAKQRYDRRMFNRFATIQGTPEQRRTQKRAFFAQQAENRRRFNQQYRRPQFLRSAVQPRPMPFRGRRRMPLTPYRGFRRNPRAEAAMLPFRFRRGRR
jgi:hypothetical protein